MDHEGIGMEHKKNISPAGPDERADDAGTPDLEMTDNVAAALGHAMDLALLHIVAFVHHDLADDIACQQDSLSPDPGKQKAFYPVFHGFIGPPE
jgi:hypothetical protein